MKKNIVLINQDSGYLMIDIANAMAVADWHCTLITGRLVQRDKPLNEKIIIKKIIRYDRSSNLKRIFTWAIAFVQLLFQILFIHRKSHLFIVSNPPFAPLLPLFCRNTFSLLIFDVYPDTLTEFGILAEQSWIVKWWKKANHRIYNKADHLYTITDGMKSVLQRYADNKTVEVVPIWTDNNFLKPLAKKDNPFVRQHGLLGKFVVLYSGNLGYSHDVEAIVELAARINNLDILFLIIGDGDKKTLIEKRIQEYGLENCMLLPFQKTTDLPYSLSSADLAIVTLGNQASRLSIPSKTFNLMSVGVPLLCIASQESELAALVEKYNIGKCLCANQLEEMEDFVNELVSNSLQLKTLKGNALKASLAFGPNNVSKLVPQ